MSAAPDLEAPGSGDAWARDRLEAVAYIASLIGHEARNRFASLRGALELMHAGMEGNLSAEYRATLLRELDEFIGDFNLGLEMLRGHCGAAEPVSLRDLVTEAVGAIAPHTARLGLRVRPEFGHADDAIRTDRRLLRLTLLNLLRNAAEALPGTARPAITVRTKDAPEWIRVEISDNGPGVPPEIRDRLFLRMPSDGPGGAGLGLSLCRDAMVLLRGSVEHLTLPGEPGARFRVTVPREIREGARLRPMGFGGWLSPRESQPPPGHPGVSPERDWVDLPTVN